MYGELEWWLALSLILSPLISMGAAGVIAYGTIGGKLRNDLNTATIFTLTIAILIIIIAAILSLLHENWNEASYTLIGFQSALVCLQTTLSARLKGLGRGAWASVTESTLYFCLLLALLATAIGLDFLTAYASALLFLSVVLAAALSQFTPLPSPRHWLRRNYRNFLHVGSRFMIGGALMGTFMGAPRVFLGFWSTPEQVAEFALTFRWLSISIVIHQFVNTVFFRSIFGDIEERRRERILAITVTMVALGAIAVSMALRHAPLQRMELPLPEDIGLLAPLAIGMILWATTACLEGSLYRMGASTEQMRAVALGCLAFLAVVATTMSEESPAYQAAYAWLAGLTTIICSQYFSLRRLEQNMPLILQTSAVACTFFLIIFFL